MITTIRDFYEIIHPRLEDELGPLATQSLLITGSLAIFFKYGLSSLQSIACCSLGSSSPAELSCPNEIPDPTLPYLLTLISMAGLAIAVAKCRRN